MTPKTKRQKEVVRLSAGLHGLTDFQRKEAIRKVVPHLAKMRRDGLRVLGHYTCLDCGHKFTEDQGEEVVCPNCGQKLETTVTKRKVFPGQEFFTVITTCHQYQVIRIFHVRWELREGCAGKHELTEVFQRWMSPDGKSTIISRARTMYPYHRCPFSLCSDLTLRSENDRHSIDAEKTVGHPRYIPMLKRNGFTGNDYGLNRHDFFRRILTDNRVETMLKVGYGHMLPSLTNSRDRLSQYWNTIKIAIRHKYRPSDMTMWLDMLHSLEELGKDILNPRFICPEDLKASHDEWMAKLQAKRQKEARRRELEREGRALKFYLEEKELSKKREAIYLRDKGKYLGLVFIDKEISIVPLQSVREFIEEGARMHHCVYANSYYEHENSLILHAVKDGVSVATIEFDLESMKVIQCRAKHNGVPEEKERIMSIIESHKIDIEKCKFSKPVKKDETDQGRCA